MLEFRLYDILQLQAADPMVKAVRQHIAALNLINTDPERKDVDDHPAWRKIKAAEKAMSNLEVKSLAGVAAVLEFLIHDGQLIEDLGEHLCHSALQFLRKAG